MAKRSLPALTLVVFLLLSLSATPEADAGGPNKIYFKSQFGDGYARVVTTGKSDIIEFIQMPKITATMLCKADGYRVKMVGDKWFTPNKTQVTHTWVGRASEGPTAKQLGDVCRSNHSTAYLPIKITGRCKRVKGIKIAGNYSTTTVKVPFAIDCKGYPAHQSQTEPLISYWKASTKDNFVLPASRNKYATSKGFVRAYVMGEIAKGSMPGTVKLNGAGLKNPRRFASVVQSQTKTHMKQRGWTVGNLTLGWVWKTGGSGRLPLQSYYHSGRKDYALSGRPDVTQKLMSAGYKFIRNEGYIRPIKK